MTSMKKDNPAMQSDLSALEAALRSEIHSVKVDMKKMKDSLNEGIDRVLTVLINNDKRLTSMVNGHERRIGKLEKHAGWTA